MFATLTTPLTSCAPSQYGSTRIDIPRAGTQNDDLNPARISDAEISWHDPSDGGNYRLDRKSEKLTVVIASSTGGYSLFHRCKL